MVATAPASVSHTVRSTDYARVVVDRTHARSMVATASGIVASEHPLASQAGASVLAAGGHAVDAAIAANAVMGVVAPMMNGAGGEWVQPLSVPYRGWKVYELPPNGQGIAALMMLRIGTDVLIEARVPDCVRASDPRKDGAAVPEPFAL